MVDDGRTPENQNSAELAAYSKRIVRLRRILPVIAILLCVLLVLAANPDFPRMAGNKAGNKAGNETGGDGDNRLLIDRPVFAGRLADGRAYRLVALRGMQKNDGTMAFSAAQMRLAANDENPSLFFTARNGLLTPHHGSGGGSAQLSGDVTITTGNGYRINAPIIDMNLADAQWRAEAGVTMTGADSSLRAESLFADENSAVYRFENIRMRLSRQPTDVPR